MNRKEYKRKWARNNKESMKNAQRRYWESNPWARAYHDAKSRCKDKSNKWYCCKGIMFLISMEEIKSIWIRDFADKMITPSIDRLDSKGNYCFDNCRFIELSENAARAARKPVYRILSNGKKI